MATKDIGRKNPVAKAGLDTGEYIDERTGAKFGLRWFLFRNVPRGTSWYQTLGFSAMAIFGMQAITGIILAMYYKPDTRTAYRSIQVITHDLSWGWLVRGMHKWGASAMIVLVFLHMGRVFIFGSYKYPRELTWLTGAILLIMTMFMGLTGYLLVWDQKAYWATVVAVNITATAPVIGPYVGDILRSGREFGPDTLSRFYSIHMLLIPAGIATFIVLHLYLITKLGIAEPPFSKRRLALDRADEEARRRAAREKAALPRGRTPVPAGGDGAPAPARAETAE